MTKIPFIKKGKKKKLHLKDNTFNIIIVLKIFILKICAILRYFSIFIFHSFCLVYSSSYSALYKENKCICWSITEGLVFFIAIDSGLIKVTGRNHRRRQK